MVRITLPPLRERLEDIPPLVRHFLDELCRQNQRPLLRISPEALERITAFPWPGNIRELRNAVEQMVVFATGETIEVANLPPAIRGTEPVVATSTHGAILTGQLNLSEVEKQCILRALEQTGQNRTQAAACLGISRRTLQRRLKELGLEIRMRQNDTTEPFIGSIAPIWHSKVKKKGETFPSGSSSDRGFR